MNLKAYFIRRFLLIIPTFLGVTLIVFAMTRFVPGGPVDRMIQEAQQLSANEGGGGGIPGGASALSQSQIDELKAYYGFDKPWYISYAQWIGKVLRGDLGYSSRYGDPVWNLIKMPFLAMLLVLPYLFYWLLNLKSSH